MPETFCSLFIKMNNTVLVLPLDTNVLFVDYYIVDGMSPLFFVAIVGICFLVSRQRRHNEEYSESVVDTVPLKV